jgi:hypothetical protein
MLLFATGAGMVEGQSSGPAGEVTARVGTLLQFTGDFEDDRSFPGDNGFRVDNARIRVVGTLPGGIAYSLQTNQSSLLEARITLPVMERLVADAGLFKPPLSGEFLQSTHSLDLLYRAQAVRTLIEGRDVGAQLRLDVGALEMRGGVFNGSPAAAGNDEEGFHSAVRAELRHRGGAGDTLRLGAFVARSGDPSSLRGEGMDTRFLSLRRLVGIDVRWALRGWFGTVEWMEGESDEDPAARPSGGQATLGFRPTPRGEVVIRWDRVDSDLAGVEPSELLVGALGHRPTRELRLQAGAMLPLEGPADGVRLLLRSQIYF